MPHGQWNSPNYGLLINVWWYKVACVLLFANRSCVNVWYHNVACVLLVANGSSYYSGRNIYSIVTVQDVNRIIEL